MTLPKLDGVRIVISAGVFLVVVIVLGLGWAFSRQLRLAQELGGEVEQLEQALATQEAEQAYLTATLEYVLSDDYVSQWAREEAKMAKPGEVVMIPMVGGGAAEPEAAATPAPQDESALEPEAQPFWRVWLDAIFGSGAETP